MMLSSFLSDQNIIRSRYNCREIHEEAFISIKIDFKKDKILSFLESILIDINASLWNFRQL